MRLVIRPILALLLALSLAACAGGGATQKTADKAAANNKSGSTEQASENPYAKSYVNKGRPTIALQPDPDGPKIYRGQNQVNDYKLMLENGFDMVGYSSFKGRGIAPEKATEQAKDIKADLVLLYAEKKGSTPASVQIDQARKNAGDGANKAQDQTLYEYFASYWVKLAPPLIGVHVEANTQDDKRFGLRVMAVVRESPAARAAIQEDDVLTRIGDVALDKPEALTQAAQRYAGQTVDVLYKRGDNEGKTVMTLNNRQ
ncbi:MAG TPA: PDZ domain-containing protein [Methylophilaceae bacterium]|nr:PDZ domain-containing protein [Methylophilaceae bacterium]